MPWNLGNASLPTDKCSLPGCERHVAAPVPVSPPAKKNRSAKKKATAAAPASAPKTAPVAAAAAPVGAGQLQQLDLGALLTQQLQQYLQQFQLKLPPPGAVVGNVPA